jgi:hypothetical protein
MLAGLITYLLLAIYYYEEHGESVSIKRVRQVRNNIQNESRTAEFQDPYMRNQDNDSPLKPYASPNRTLLIVTRSNEAFLKAPFALFCKVANNQNYFDSRVLLEYTDICTNTLTLIWP